MSALSGQQPGADSGKVAVVFTGGTISMRIDPVLGGPVPALHGQELLALTPGIDEMAETVAIDWGLVPASHLSFDQVIDLADTVRSAAERVDVAGVVVVQGTDTIEETSFALDLLVETAKPIVVVGAMRNASEDGFDGPANLRGAVRCAVAPSLAGAGVVVAMAGEIHAADDVVKTHSDAYTTFQSPNFGRLGVIDSAGICIARRKTGHSVLHARRAEPVALVTVGLGMDAAILDVLRIAGAHGIVVAATGAGNTHPDFVEQARAAIEAGVPVVLATRCSAGRAKPAYGFPGGGRSWQQAGAIFAGFLHPLKARVALSLALGAGMTRVQLEDYFAQFG